MKIVCLSKEYMYINEDDRVVRSEIKKEKAIITSTLGYSHILNINFKLQKPIDKDMLEIEAEKYIFTEASIDYNKEYKIIYKYREFEEFYNVEAFIVDAEVLKQEFEKYIKVFKYIDFISPKPFVFKSFYDITNTTPKNDVFIYIDENEAFLSCFENSEFVFVKSINKLSTLAKDLNLSIEESIEILKSKGLNKELYEDENQYNIVDSFFSQFFMKVNNIINYSTNYYRLEKINNIYVYSSFEINNLIDNYKNFWNLSGINFQKYEINSDYDPFDYTATIYNSKNYENEEENLTIFPKPIPFYKTKTGIISLVFFFVFLLVVGDAFYRYHIISNQEKQILILKKKILRKKRQIKLINSVYKKLTKEIISMKKENKDLKLQISDIENKVDYLKTIYTATPFSNKLDQIIYLLKKHNLKITNLDKNSTSIEISLISDYANSSNIAQFMKDLIRYNYKNITFYKIDNNGSIYTTKVFFDE